jgi:hypothetical protein
MCQCVFVCVMYRQSWTHTNTHHTLRHLNGRVCVRMVCVGRVAPDDGTLENVLFVCSDLRAIHQFKAAAPSKEFFLILGLPLTNTISRYTFLSFSLFLLLCAHLEDHVLCMIAQTNEDMGTHTYTFTSHFLSVYIYTHAHATHHNIYYYTHTHTHTLIRSGNCKARRQSRCYQAF